MIGRVAFLVVCAFPVLVQAAVEQQVVDAALGEDDQCARDDAQCALKAMQVKAVKNSANSANLPWQCTSGIVNRIRHQGEECFNRCPEMCGPIGVAVKQFFMGGASAVRRSICSMQDNFHCAQRPENAEVCLGFIAKAKAFRVDLPPTADQLAAQCNALLQVKASKEVSEVKTSANSANLPWQCTSGIVNRIRHITGPQGEECFNRCPEMCGPIGVAVKKFFSGGSSAVRRSICSMQDNFHCAQRPENAEVCLGFIAKAKAFRVDLPPTADQLAAQCNAL